MTKNLLLNELRRQLNSENLKDEVKKLSVSPEYSLSEQIEYEELKTKIDQIVGELPERQKEIFIISRNEGLSHKEIAEKLGIKTKTVEYHIGLAIKEIKIKLQKLGIMSILYFYLFF